MSATPMLHMLKPRDDRDPSTSGWSCRGLRRPRASRALLAALAVGVAASVAGGASLGALGSVPSAAAGPFFGAQAHRLPTKAAVSPVVSPGYDLVAFRQETSQASTSSTEKHHPYNHDWVWIILVIGGAFVVGTLVIVRFYAGRPDHRPSQPERDGSGEPPSPSG